MGTGVNVSKAVLYAVFEPDTGVNAAKVITHAVMEPDKGINVSKVILHAIMDINEGINVSKAVAYAVDGEPPVPGEIATEIKAAIDSLAYSRQEIKTGNFSETIKAAVDSISYELATNISINMGEQIKPAIDEIAGILRHAFVVNMGEQIKPAIDEIDAGTINLEKPARWVAPLAITPKVDDIDALYFAAHPVRHPTMYFSPKVKSYGLFTRKIAAPAEFVRSGDVTVKISDADNEIRQAIAPKTIKKAEGDLRLGPEGGKYSAFLRPWRRSLAHLRQPADGELDFVFKDLLVDYLARDVPRVITAENFPNLPDNPGQEFANLIIGTVAAEGGALSCPLVDPDNYWYLLSRHISSDITVFRKADDSDAFEAVSGSEYSIKTDYYVEHELGSGDYCTIIKFNSDQGGKQIRANASCNTTLTNFADCIEAMFLYLVWVYDRTDILNTASFEETRARVADLECAGAWTKPITFGEALTQLQRSSNIDVFTDKFNRITVKYTLDDESVKLNLSDLSRHYKGSVSQEIANPSFNQIPYRYAPNYAANTWKSDVYNNAEDQEKLGEVTKDTELNLYFVRDAATALTVVERRAQYQDLNSFRWKSEIPLVPVVESLELADIVGIDHFGGIKEGGYQNEQFKVLELGMDINNLKYIIKGIRRRLPAPEMVETYSDDTGRGGEIGGGTQDDTGTYIQERQGVSGVGTDTNARCGPFMDPEMEGELFGIFRNSAAKNKLVAYLTQNTGVTWVERDVANAPALANEIDSFDAFYKNGIIYVATQEKNTGRVAYHVFDTLNRQWIEKNTEVCAATTANGHCVSIECRNPGGEPVIYFQGDRALVEGIYYERGYYSILMGGSWNTPALVTPDPGDYPENQPGYPYAAQKPSSNCHITRVCPGQENRMHFFYFITPAVVWVQGTQDEYAVTMYDNLSISDRQILYISSVYYPAGRNIGTVSPSNNYKNIILTRRRGWYNPYVAVYSEGITLSKVNEKVMSYGITGIGVLGDENPACIAGIDSVPDPNTIYLASQNYANPGYQILQESLDNGETWGDGIKTGPWCLGIQHTLCGNFFKVRNKMYFAAFFSEWPKPYPTYRWIKIESLPYTEA